MRKATAIACERTDARGWYVYVAVGRALYQVNVFTARNDNAEQHMAGFRRRIHSIDRPKWGRYVSCNTAVAALVDPVAVAAIEVSP